MALVGPSDVSLERMKTLELLDYTRLELLLAVLVVASAFGALDLLLQLTVRPALARLLRPIGAPATAKASPVVVTKALVIAVSFVHLAIQIPIGLAVLRDPRLAADPVYGVSALSVAMVIISSGYFLYDLATVMLRYDTDGLAFLVHALCCLFVYGYAVFYNTLHWFGAAFLMWELSTPFVHVRYLMHATGRTNSALYVANGLTMVLVFFCCRNLWGVWCSVQFFRATQAELDAPREGGFSPAGIWGYRIANVALNALNALWFSKMATKAAQLLLGKDGKRTMGSAPAVPKKQR